MQKEIFNFIIFCGLKVYQQKKSSEPYFQGYQEALRFCSLWAKLSTTTRPRYESDKIWPKLPTGNGLAAELLSIFEVEESIDDDQFISHLSTLINKYFHTDHRFDKKYTIPDEEVITKTEQFIELLQRVNTFSTALNSLAFACHHCPELTVQDTGKDLYLAMYDQFYSKYTDTPFPVMLVNDQNKFKNSILPSLTGIQSKINELAKTSTELLSTYIHCEKAIAILAIVASLAILALSINVAVMSFSAMALFLGVVCVVAAGASVGGMTYGFFKGKNVYELEENITHEKKLWDTEADVSQLAYE